MHADDRARPRCSRGTDAAAPPSEPLAESGCICTLRASLFTGQRMPPRADPSTRANIGRVDGRTRRTDLVELGVRKPVAVVGCCAAPAVKLRPDGLTTVTASLCFLRFVGAANATRLLGLCRCARPPSFRSAPARKPSRLCADRTARSARPGRTRARKSRRPQHCLHGTTGGIGVDTPRNGQRVATGKARGKSPTSCVSFAVGVPTRRLPCADLEHPHAATRAFCRVDDRAFAGGRSRCCSPQCRSPLLQCARRLPGQV